MLRIAEEKSGSPEGRLRERFGLTMREAEVLLWLSRGKANKDIAEILSLSPRTVNKHLEQIYAKLGVENRTAAATLASKAIADS
jgi:DNA-binding CsgD family transcriptional regulator